MMLLLLSLALLMAILVTLVTCLQVLYLESLRIRARELPALQFFKETLEAKVGIETERGSLAFSLVKHIGLGIIGCLAMAAAIQARNSFGQSLAIACLSASLYTVIGTYIVPQLFYRKSNAHFLLLMVPLFRAALLAVTPLLWALEFLQSLFELGDAQTQEEPTRPEEHIEALISAGEEEGIIEKGDRELIQSVVAFGDKTVREVMTPRPRIVAIREDASLEELRQLVIHEQFSRIPAFPDGVRSLVEARGVVYAGHVALAMLAKGVRPRVPLAVLVPVAFAPDWIEWILAAFGRQNRMLSHSLVSVALGASLVAGIYWMVSKAPWDAAIVWLTYASHWPADFITGYKPTWPGGPTVGLGMYGNPIADVVIEWTLIMICWFVYRRSLPPRRRAAKVGWLMPVGLMAMQIAFYAIQNPEVKEQVREVISQVHSQGRDPSLRS